MTCQPGPRVHNARGTSAARESEAGMRSDLLVVLEDLKSEIENGVNTLAEPSDRDKLIRHLRGWLRQLQDEVEGDPVL